MGDLVVVQIVATLGAFLVLIGAGTVPFCLVRCSDDLQLSKVIAVSGKLTDGQAQHLINQGVDGYLKKPFHVRSVIEAVEDAVALVY